MPKPNEPRMVPAEALERIEGWSRRKPRVALMGEFSSGKSTLLNLLLGEDLLPTRITASGLPPVWLSHGAPRAAWRDREGVEYALDIGDLAGVPSSARYVRLFAPAPILESCDLLDTPGISDPNLEGEPWRFAAGQANAVLWCTPATQAWRETERSAWLSLPERLRARSLLVVTRADKLASLGDRDKVARRLSRETAGLFAGLVFLAGPDAESGRQLLDSTGDSGAWTQSGAAELLDRLDEVLAAIRAERARLLARYRLSGAAFHCLAVATVPALPGALPAEAAPEPIHRRDVEHLAERPSADQNQAPPTQVSTGWTELRSAHNSHAEPADVVRPTQPRDVQSLAGQESEMPWPDDEEAPMTEDEQDRALEALILAANTPGTDARALTTEDDEALHALLRAANVPEDEAPRGRSPGPAEQPLQPREDKDQAWQHRWIRVG